VANQLLDSDEGAVSLSLPDTPRALSGCLRRAASFLRQAGLDIVFDRVGQPRTRTITITKISQKMDN
jgi:hypothetical protein